MLETILKSSYFSAGLAIVLTLVSKRQQSIVAEHLWLGAAWGLLVLAAYQTPVLARQSIIPRVLWTDCVAAVLGLALFYAFWTPSTAPSADRSDLAHATMSFVSDRAPAAAFAVRSSNNVAAAPAPVPEISWTFDNNPNNPPVLGLSSSFGEEPYVFLFQAYGHNNTEHRFKNVNGVIRSEVTDLEFPLGMNVGGSIVKPEETNGIPPNGDFALMTWPLPSNNEGRSNGITISRFLVQFPAFRLVVNYDGRQYVRRFSHDEVLGIIERFQRETTANNINVKPTVTLKRKSLQ